MVWPPVEFGLNLLTFLDSLSRSLMVIPGAAPRSAWMGGFLSLTGKSSVAKAGDFGLWPFASFAVYEFLDMGPALLSSGEAGVLFLSLWLLLLLISMLSPLLTMLES